MSADEIKRDVQSVREWLAQWSEDTATVPITRATLLGMLAIIERGVEVKD